MSAIEKKIEAARKAFDVIDAIHWELYRIKAIKGTSRDITYLLHSDSNDQPLIDLEIIDAKAISEHLPGSFQKTPPEIVAAQVLPILRSIKSARQSVTQS